MGVSRNPARPVSGSPAYSPDDLPAYRGGSDASSASFPLSLYAESSAGDYWDLSDITKIFQDTGKTTPAATPGDVIGACVGQRSLVDLTQATTGSKPLLESYGGALGARMNAGTTRKFMTGTFGADLLPNTAALSVTLAVHFSREIHTANSTPVEITSGSTTKRLGIFAPVANELQGFASYSGASVETTPNIVVGATSPLRRTAIITATNNGRCVFYIYNGATLVDSQTTTIDRPHEVGAVMSIGRIISNAAAYFNGVIHASMCIDRELVLAERVDLATFWSAL